MSQTQFARALQVSTQAVQNWENARRRPHPKHLKRMAELVPVLAAELQKESAAYAWHRGARKSPPVLEISTPQRELAERLSVVLNLDIAQVLEDALTRGLKALDSSSVPTSKLKERTMEARADVTAKYLPGTRHKRKAK